jgi:hypothetical protein
MEFVAAPHERWADSPSACTNEQLLVNGSADGLVEVTIEPPCYTDRTPSTMFVKERVNSLLVSLADPDGFIAAIEDHGHA